MSEQLHHRIIAHLKSGEYRPQDPQALAKELSVKQEGTYPAFRDALRELMHAGRVVLGASGTIVLPSEHHSHDEFVGSYRHNKRGFGFVVPTDPSGREDLYIPEGQNAGAITGDVVRATITNRGHRDGKAIFSGRITEILQRTQKRFAGTLTKVGNEWIVMPDGNTITQPILAPDAASRHIRPGTKVVIEITTYPETGERASGVITEVLGAAGEKDVDLRSVIVGFNLPGPFPDSVLAQARESVDSFDPATEGDRRVDLSDQVICTIDPDDAKDYDDAISLRQLDNGHWELGVHIADVAHFVPAGTPLDEEAFARGNSCYFPGHVIPMLPAILSNGVCSLQEGVPRLCKSAFITYDEEAQPISAKFANTIIKSAKRLRYREAQAIIDAIDPADGGGAPIGPSGMRVDLGAPVPHPEGDRHVGDYEPHIIELLGQMNTLSRRLQKRRLAAGQLVLDLPEVELVLDEDGKVVGVKDQDHSFTHTLIEMFMVEANEASARLLDTLHVPYLRRVHPEPELRDSERLRQFVGVAGFKLPKVLDRKSIQTLLAAVRGKPEAHAINLAILKSLTRAEYAPEKTGHYALASDAYSHFTSPIRRYADLTVHRLLDNYLTARQSAINASGKPKRAKIDSGSVPSHDDLVEVGRHLSFTERRAEDAERELRQVKVLELLSHHLGEEFTGVITGITNFGIFVQIQKYLIDGLIRYEKLMDDWWDVDEKSGIIRGQRTGKQIGIGDVVKVIVARVDLPRRELDLSITELVSRGGRKSQPLLQTGKPGTGKNKPRPAPARKSKQPQGRGATIRGRRQPSRGKRK